MNKSLANKEFHLCYQRDMGYFIQLVYRPVWAGVLELAWEGVCWATRGWAGGHGMPEVMWRIPVGPAKYADADPGFLTNSVASLACDLENFVYRVASREVLIDEILVEEEWVRDHFGDFWSVDGDDDDWSE